MPHSSAEHRCYLSLNSAQLLACLLLTLLGFGANSSRTPHDIRNTSADSDTVPSTYLHDAWTTENGLPQNDVKLLQSRDGYLWLGTHGGLARFDGVNFAVFDTGNSPALRGNRILTLAEDNKGNLWIGCQYGGLTKYAGGSFTNYGVRDGLPDDSVFDILAVKDGSLWLSTPKGLAHFDGTNFRVYTGRDGMPSDGSGYLKQTPDGVLWFISGGSLVSFQNNTFQRYDTIAGLPSDWATLVFSMHAEPDNSLLLATSYGLVQFKDGAFNIISRSNAGNDQPLPADIVLAIFSDRTGQTRLLTPSGTAHLEKKQIVFDVAIPELSEMKLRMWTIKSVIEDREGNIWLGAGGIGLHRFKPRKILSYGALQGLPEVSFVPITGGGDGTLWFGNADPTRGLVGYKDGRFSFFNLNATVRSLFAAGDGTLWIGTERDGIFTLKNGSLKHNDDLSNLSNGSSINAIYGTRDGAMWIGLGGDEGQVGGLLRIRNDETIRYRTNDGLVSNDVRFITEDHSGQIWIGTTGGISRFDGAHFQNFTTAQGLSINYVREIYEDAEGTIWIGTYGGGLNRYRDGRITPITTANGLFDNVVSRILEDNRGNLWMSCNRGLFRASKADLNAVADGRSKSVDCISYGVADGMTSNETNGGSEPAGWKDADGRLWFPTVKGVVSVDPEKLNTLPPPVIVEQVKVGNNAVDSLHEIVIQPGQGDLEIHYTGLSLIAPEKMRFKYKLEGYDTDWVDAGTRRVAYYTNTPAGRYRFSVMASNNDGVWGITTSEVAIRVIPPLWKTWWFTILFLLMAVALLALLYRRRVGRIELARKNQQAFSRQLIESQENERKRIAGELHDSLGQNLLIIKNYALLGIAMAEPTGSATERFDEISKTASVTLDEVRSIAHNLRPYQLDRLGLTRAIESIVKSATDASAIEFISSVDRVDSLFDTEREINLFRIIQECVNNILKHSRASHASISVVASTESVDIVIRDDGVGFNIDSSNGFENDATGFGLRGIQERARILGTVPQVKSALGAGTSVIIRVPVQIHLT